MTVQRDHRTYPLQPAVLLDGGRPIPPRSRAGSAPPAEPASRLAVRIVAALAVAVAVLVGGTTEAVRAQAPDSTAGAVMQRLSPGAHRLPPLPLGNDRLSVAARAFPVRTVSGSGTSVQGAPPESQTRASDASVPDAPAPGASAPEAGATWTLTVDGQAADWPGGDPPATAPIGDLEHVASQVLERLRARGYYYARIDSATVRRSASPPRVRLHATRGPQVVVGSITLSGTSAVEVASLRRELRTQPGRPLRPDRLKRDLDAMLQTYEDAGYPLAQIRIAETTLRRGSPAQLDLRLHVDEGPALWLKAITLPEEARTSPSLVAHLADLQMGERMTGYNPATIRRRLQRADVFASVGPPELRVDAEGGATLHVPVEETSPGSFDLALGYLPPSPGGGGGQIVGSGRLALRNLFGGARTARLKLDRRPGQTSLFDVSAADPRLFGRPLRLEGRFRGEQRDSTFSQRRYRGTLGYRFGGGWEVLGTVSREVTRPGQEGAQVRGRRQAIPRSEALFYGVGLRFEHVDRPRNPRRGGRLMLRLERGQKERRFLRRAGANRVHRPRLPSAVRPPGPRRRPRRVRPPQPFLRSKRPVSRRRGAVAARIRRRPVPGARRRTGPPGIPASDRPRLLCVRVRRFGIRRTPGPGGRRRLARLAPGVRRRHSVRNRPRHRERNLRPATCRRQPGKRTRAPAAVVRPLSLPPSPTHTSRPNASSALPPHPTSSP
mgnify:CR=1 FL=1